MSTPETWLAVDRAEEANFGEGQLDERRLVADRLWIGVEHGEREAPSLEGLEGHAERLVVVRHGIRQLDRQVVHRHLEVFDAVVAPERTVLRDVLQLHLTNSHGLGEREGQDRTDPSLRVIVPVGGRIAVDELAGFEAWER